MAPHTPSTEGGEDMDHQTPASPATEYLYTTVLSLRMLCVFEAAVPIEDSGTFKVIRELLLPLNPRFSSILIKHGKTGLQWQRVNVNLEDHVRVPSFPEGLSPAQYEEHWYDYLSQIAMESFPEQRPLWEVHLFKYPFGNAAGAVVLKLHHALGDGFSLMGALFSCLKRADDPSLPLTFPPTSSAAMSGNSMGESERVVSNRPGNKAISMVRGCCNTLEDAVKSLLHSTVMKDARSCIRSGRSQLEYLATAFSSVVLSLARIKEVKNEVAGTVNDVVTGMLFYGIHLYNQKKGQSYRGKRMTAIVLLNTRMVRGYQKIEDMLENKSWGNHFTLLYVPIPRINTMEEDDPLTYISQAKQVIKRQRNSLAFFFIGSLLSLIGKIKGPEAVSRYIYNSLHNTSVGISNLIGPAEQVAIAGQPVKNLYFYMAGVPQSVATSVVSYMDQVTMTVCAEKDFVDPNLFTQCVNEAFEKIYDKTCGKNRE